MKPDYRCRIADWHTDRQALQAIRHRVFVTEQHVPEDMEWDEFDAVATHFIVATGGQAVATARLKADGQVGRMAVLPEHRGRGVGRLLLETLIGHAERAGLHRLTLHAQVQVTGFYAGFGFVCEGEEFIEAGIRHLAMCRNCAKNGV